MYRPCSIPDIKFSLEEKNGDFELEDASTSIGDSKTEVFNYSCTRN